MPYPRRVIIYLREKGIPSSLVTIVPVSDPQLGNSAPPEYPPRPAGSFPILAIAPGAYLNNQSYTYIRQSKAIMNFLDELCDGSLEGVPVSIYSMRGTNPLSRARDTELFALADECTANWNPVRTFGSGAGTMSIPIAAKDRELVERPRLLVPAPRPRWAGHDGGDRALLIFGIHQRLLRSRHDSRVWTDCQGCLWEGCGRPIYKGCGVL
jgi:glutathione S-transferase